jgi:hypothetical protein
MSKAKTKTATTEVEKTPAQINFEKSVERIKENRSTGNAQLDELGSKILYGIHEGKLKFAEAENGYEGKLGKADISVKKVPHGEKSTRIVLGVAGMEIQGEFAARAYKMAHASLNKKGRKSIQVDEEQVNDVMSLLD